jgi:hypothetical protein
MRRLGAFTSPRSAFRRLISTWIAALDEDPLRSRAGMDRTVGPAAKPGTDPVAIARHADPLQFREFGPWLVADRT